jgi:hypothetical protein
MRQNDLILAGFVSTIAILTSAGCADPPDSGAQSSSEATVQGPSPSPNSGADPPSTDGDGDEGGDGDKDGEGGESDEPQLGQDEGGDYDDQVPSVPAVSNQVQLHGSTSLGPGGGQRALPNVDLGDVVTYRSSTAPIEIASDIFHFTVDSIDIEPTDEGTGSKIFALGSDACLGTEITSAQTCVISVKFVPTLAQSYGATLIVHAHSIDGPVSGTGTITLSGSGIDAPRVDPPAISEDPPVDHEDPRRGPESDSGEDGEGTVESNVPTPLVPPNGTSDTSEPSAPE